MEDITPCHSKRMVKGYVWRNGYPLEKIDVVYPGAKVKDFYTQDVPKLDKLRIAYAGIVLPYKGAHVLIKALMYLKQNGIDFSATLTGTQLMKHLLMNLRKFAEKQTWIHQLPLQDS